MRTSPRTVLALTLVAIAATCSPSRAPVEAQAMLSRTEDGPGVQVANGFAAAAAEAAELSEARRLSPPAATTSAESALNP